MYDRRAGEFQENGTAANAIFLPCQHTVVMMYRFLFAIALSTLGMACLRASDEDASIEVGSESLYFEAVGAGQAGSLADTTETVLRTESEWITYTDSLRSPEAFQPVDFSQTMLVLVALPQASGGYRIQMESVEAEEDGLVASYVVYAPGPDCMVIMAQTLPFQVVAVRRSPGDMTFRRRVELESCSLD